MAMKNFAQKLLALVVIILLLENDFSLGYQKV